MRLAASIVICVVLLTAAACAPASRDTGDVRTPAISQGASNDSMPPGAAGKISADQVGKVSPVPAFQGGGGDWSIEIRSLGDMRHSVKLVSGDEMQTGTAVYQPTTAAQPQILLIGTLYASAGDRALRITLRRDACSDAEGRAHQHRVRVEITGARPLQGCGDLAVY